MNSDTGYTLKMLAEDVAMGAMVVGTSTGFLVLASWYVVYYSRHTSRGGALDDTPLELTALTALLFPLVASGVLLLSYFLFGIFWVMVSAMVLGSLAAIPFVLHPLLGRIGILANRCTACPSFQVVDVLSLAVALGAVAWWLSTGYWLPHDFIAICLGCFALTYVRVGAMKWCAVLLAGLFFYDIFWVFLSPSVVGHNVMVSVATRHATYLKSPGTIIFPAPWTERGYGILGLGDLVLPGLAVVYCVRYDLRRASGSSPSNDVEKGLLGTAPPKTARYTYTAFAIAGYTAGLVLCSIALTMTDTSQPALMYVVPCTLPPPLVLAWRHEALNEFWNGWPEKRAEAAD